MSDQRGWWFSSEDDHYDPLTPSVICKGYNKSIELVNSTFASQVSVISNLVYLFCSINVLLHCMVPREIVRTSFPRGAVYSGKT